MRTAALADARDAALAALEAVRQGARFVGIFGDVLDGRTALTYLVAERELAATVGFANGTVPSIALDVPAALWHEREVSERFAVALAGLPDPRPMRVPGNTETLRRVDGPEASTILYGPVRSGIVESARWLIETGGEDFLSVFPSMFFKRRGAEERFVGVDLELAPFVAEHVSGATAASHATAFCAAAERALGIEVPDRARAARAILIEFERIHQHLDSLAKLADDGSLSVGSAQTYAAKERVHRLLADATGSRFSRGVVCVGGLREDVYAGIEESCSRRLDTVERETLAVLHGLFRTQSLLDRLIGTGRLSDDLVRRFGGVGPVARGSGVAGDVRQTGLPSGVVCGSEALEPEGDALARSRVRRNEIEESFRLVRAWLATSPAAAIRTPIPTRLRGTGVARVESPQGELVYHVRLDDGIRRVAVRSASYANWPLFVPSLPGNIFTDFSFIEHSFGLIQAETDR